jgi:hypothetical protein
MVLAHAGPGDGCMFMSRVRDALSFVAKQHVVDAKQHVVDGLMTSKVTPVLVTPSETRASVLAERSRGVESSLEGDRGLTPSVGSVTSRAQAISCMHAVLTSSLAIRLL